MIKETNSWSVWIAGALLSLIVAGCTLYIKWVNDSITNHDKVILDIAIKLERIDTKLDMELRQHGLEIPKH